MGNMLRESKQEAYDVVVIGAGMGGLSAAALLAKAGQSVLLVERHDRPGGYAHGFTRRKYRFDSGVHLISGCSRQGYRNGSIIYKIGQALGISTESTFLPIPAYARICYPQFELLLHSGEEAFVAGLAERFPAEQDNILKLSRLCRVLAEEIMIADEVLRLDDEDLPSPALTLATLFRYRRATLSSVLDEFFADPQLKSAYASLWPYLGLPPSKLSFLYWATMMAGYTYEGGFYCRGSFQNYADSLAGKLRELGGELLLNASVRRICVEQGKACGIMLENGQRIGAKAVISNADAWQTADSLIGRRHLPEDYWNRLARLSPSISVFVTYLATDLDFAGGALAHESFFFRRLDHEASYAGALEGRFDWFSATLSTLADASLAPPGQHLLVLTALCPYAIGESWRQAKPRFQQCLLEQAERQFPGLNDHLLLVESGSPRTLERYTLNHQGAAYGWAPAPDQIGPHRPDVRGALPGLYHAGHWTRPGGGVAGVSVSGLLAAQAVLDIPRLEDFWRLLGVEPN
ncbi:MAG: NAD(P)/FAD-dependent oxidoreductase [Methylococcaceae bacterium]|nr:NAD(P)/FAD-dependent oxidoreductase [Methylococcaceae bacterium]